MASILVVDDHSTSQRLMSFILQQNNHEVVTALHGRQALERLAKASFDLVITDLNMPELDGLSLLYQMRADARYRTIPVIILTGSVHEQDNLRVHAAGATAFLTKPVGSDELIATVNELLVARPSEATAPEGADVLGQRKDSSEAQNLLGVRLNQKIHVI